MGFWYSTDWQGSFSLTLKTSVRFPVETASILTKFLGK